MDDFYFLKLFLSGCPVIRIGLAYQCVTDAVEIQDVGQPPGMPVDLTGGAGGQDDFGGRVMDHLGCVTGPFQIFADDGLFEFVDLFVDVFQ